MIFLNLNNKMKTDHIKRITAACMMLLSVASVLRAQQLMTNVYGRDCRSLNGKWNAIVDQYDQGGRMKVFENRKPEGKTDFYEYSFDGGLRLNVPGDWNSQTPELKYYEGTVWYARHFDAEAVRGRRQFFYFGAVSRCCTVYLNGDSIMSHEGAFTPFQVEVTGKLKSGDNLLVVEVDNRRTPQAIPAMAFDWWNYGGITRDVFLVQTPQNYIDEYFIRLDKDNPKRILADVSLAEAVAGEKIRLTIPGLKTTVEMSTDSKGKAMAEIKAGKPELWEPGNPRLYDITITTAADTVKDEIGFRTITVSGTDVCLNGRPVFFRGVSFHEEIPQRMGRAFSEADATMLLSEAEALGVNLIRLAHYPQNEHIVRMAERMGIMLWQEIPVWQGIDFADKGTLGKAETMLGEMIKRDRNRCAVCFWGVANETKPSAERNAFLKELLRKGKSMDDSRLYTAAFDLAAYNPDSRRFEMHDPFIDNLDVVAVNKYMGWYHPWPVKPEDAVWNVASGKPLIISEFGGEALYGVHGNEDVASSWSEDYQAELYKDNLRMFDNIPNLRGVSPWVLFDFRSPFRFHPSNQDGWNRKGLVSDQGERKKAWYIMRDYYMKKRNRR